MSRSCFPESWPSATDTHKHTEKDPKEEEEERREGKAQGPLPASGSEAACSLSEGLEGTPTWLELHSVLRGKEPARGQEKESKMREVDDSLKGRSRTPYGRDW